MILTALAALLLLRQGADELARVKEFVRVAHIGREGLLLPPYDQQGEPTIRDHTESVWSEFDSRLVKQARREYRFGYARVDVDGRTGRIVYYTVVVDFRDYPPAFTQEERGNEMPVPRALTNAEAVSLAEQAYAAAGWPGGIAPYEMHDLYGNNNTCVEVGYSPVWRGIPYEGTGDTIEVNRQTGRLEKFRAGFTQPGSVSAPPLSLLTGGNLGEARLVALRSMLVWRKAGTFRENPMRPLRLVLWQPRYYITGAYEAYGAHQGGRIEPFHVAELRAGRAILAYSGTLTGSDGREYNVRLDARTGFPLTLSDDWDPVGRAGSGGLAAKPPPVPRPVPVPSAARPWRVGAGQKGWNAWSAPATASLTPVPAKALIGRRVDLTDGRSAFPATYDAKANLLGIEGRTYRPGPALAGLLRRTAAAPKAG